MEGPLTTAARALIAADNDLKLATAAHADNEKHRLAHGLPDSVMEVTHDQLEASARQLPVCRRESPSRRRRERRGRSPPSSEATGSSAPRSASTEIHAHGLRHRARCVGRRRSRTMVSRILNRSSRRIPRQTLPAARTTRATRTARARNRRAWRAGGLDPGVAARVRRPAVPAMSRRLPDVSHMVCGTSLTVQDDGQLWCEWCGVPVPLAEIDPHGADIPKGPHVDPPGRAREIR